MKKFLIKLLAVIIILFGFVMIGYSQNMIVIILATFVFIAGGTVWVMSSPQSYNKAVDNIKVIEGASDIDIVKMQKDFAEYETPLGKPWVSKIKMVPGISMIFGPNADGEYIYVYKSKNKQNLLVGYNQMPSFIQPSAENTWRLQPKAYEKTGPEDVLCDMMQSAYLVEDLKGIFEQYVKSGSVTKQLMSQDKGHIYYFDEAFKLTGQSFMLYDIEGKPIYEIEGTMPLITLRIYDAQSHQMIFELTKKLLHVLPHYEFYYKNQHYGTFEKKFDLVHDYFMMQTSDGLVEMKNVTASFGDNYRVKVNGVFVGVISENLNITFDNLVFDNFVVYVKDQTYLPLMTALAVMAAREMARDNARN